MLDRVALSYRPISNARLGDALCYALDGEYGEVDDLSSDWLLGVVNWPRDAMTSR